jgi:hypothetical protein
MKSIRIGLAVLALTLFGVLVPERLAAQVPPAPTAPAPLSPLPAAGSVSAASPAPPAGQVPAMTAAPRQGLLRGRLAAARGERRGRIREKIKSLFHGGK